MPKDNKGIFDVFQAIDRLSELSSANKIDTPSMAYQFQLRLMTFFNEIHNSAYEQGFNDAMNLKLKDNDFSR